MDFFFPNNKLFFFPSFFFSLSTLPSWRCLSTQALVERFSLNVFSSLNRPTPFVFLVPSVFASSGCPSELALEFLSPGATIPLFFFILLDWLVSFPFRKE